MGMHSYKIYSAFSPMNARFGNISLIFFGTIILFQILCAAKVATGTKMHYIHWNTSNPIFRIDNTDHIIDVNKGNIRFEYDQVNIICPGYNSDSREDEPEKYIIYNVSKEEYDTCRITNSSPRIIAVCDHPNKLMYFTITFRPFSPQPGGLEFRPGQDYYFISTSSKDDMYRKIGGRCTTHHMKVVFKVCCDPSSQPAHDQANGHLPTNGLSTPRSGSSTTLSTTKLISSIPTTKSTTTTVASTTKFSTTSSRTTSRRIPSTRTQINKGRKPYADAKSSVDKKKALKNEMTRSDVTCSTANVQTTIILLTFVIFLRHIVPL